MAPATTTNDIHTVTIHHHYNHAQVYDIVSALNRQIGRLEHRARYTRDPRKAGEYKHDLHRLREIRDLWLQVEKAAQEAEGIPDYAEQLKQRLNEEG